MPAIYAHRMFGERVVSGLSRARFFEIFQYPEAYALGLQKEWINVFILRMDSRLLEQAMRQCGLAAAPEELPQILVDLEQGGVSRVSERKLNRGPLDRRFPRW